MSVGLMNTSAPDQVDMRAEELNLLEGRSPIARRAFTVAAHFGYGMGAGAVFGALRHEEDAAPSSLGRSLARCPRSERPARRYRSTSLTATPRRPARARRRRGDPAEPGAPRLRATLNPKPDRRKGSEEVALYARFESRAIDWTQRYGQLLLRISFGVVFVWFGIAKFLGTSPTEELIGGTVPLIPTEVVVPLLGVLQIAIGVCFLFRRLLRVALLLFFLHLPGTVLPLFLQPEATFGQGPLDPTIEGQFVVKNLILASAAIVLVGTLRTAGRGNAGRVM